MMILTICEYLVVDFLYLSILYILSVAMLTLQKYTVYSLWYGMRDGLTVAARYLEVWSYKIKK